MKSVVIVANGKLIISFLQDIKNADYIIGVDSGAYWLIQNGVVPHIAIGDFDSVGARGFQMIRNNIKRVKEYPKKKDFTDMELAVDHAITLQPKEVIMYGAIGTRLDHSIGNIQLLERLHGVGVLRDNNNEVRLVSKKLVLHKESCYRYVSTLPITESIEVTLKGFVYDVFHVLIRRGQTLGISNEIREDMATIDIHRGKALVIRSRDLV